MSKAGFAIAVVQKPRLQPKLSPLRGAGWGAERLPLPFLRAADTAPPRAPPRAPRDPAQPLFWASRAAVAPGGSRAERRDVAPGLRASAPASRPSSFLPSPPPRSSASMAAAIMAAEQEAAKGGGRNRGGVQRVEGKLRASVEKGDYYEAHQMYRTLFFRYGPARPAARPSPARPSRAFPRTAPRCRPPPPRPLSIGRRSRPFPPLVRSLGRAGAGRGGRAHGRLRAARSPGPAWVLRRSPGVRPWFFRAPPPLVVTPRRSGAARGTAACGAEEADCARVTGPAVGPPAALWGPRDAAPLTRLLYGPLPALAQRYPTLSSPLPSSLQARPSLTQRPSSPPSCSACSHPAQRSGLPRRPAASHCSPGYPGPEMGLKVLVPCACFACPMH